MQSRKFLALVVLALTSVASVAAGCHTSGTAETTGPSVASASSGSPVAASSSLSPGQGASSGHSTGPASQGPAPSSAPGVVGPSAAASGHVGTGGNSVAVQLHFDAVVGYYVYGPPGGLVSVSWLDPTGDSLTVGMSRLSKGNFRTGGDVNLEFSLTDPKVDSFVSGDGSCTVTVTSAAQHLFAGRFTCKGVKSLSGQTLTAGGSFSARLNVGAGTP